MNTPVTFHGGPFHGFTSLAIKATRQIVSVSISDNTTVPTKADQTVERDHGHYERTDTGFVWCSGAPIPMVLQH